MFYVTCEDCGEDSPMYSAGSSLGAWADNHWCEEDAEEDDELDDEEETDDDEE